MDAGAPPGGLPTVTNTLIDGKDLVGLLAARVEQELAQKKQRKQAREAAKVLALPGPSGQAEPAAPASESEDEGGDDESSEEEEEPPDPQQCTVTGPGYTVRNQR